MLISVNDRDKAEALEVAKGFDRLGFKILATGGTYTMLEQSGVRCERINKLMEGRPHILDAITNGEIDIIFNTPKDKQSATHDSYLRKAAVRNKTLYVSTAAAAMATVEGIEYVQKNGAGSVKSLQQYHGQIQ